MRHPETTAYHETGHVVANVWANYATSYLVTVVAGHIAEAMASGDPVRTETDEYEHAQTVAGKYHCALSGAERDARRLLRKHRDVVEAVAQALLKEQVIDQARVDTLTASIEPAT